MATRAEKSRRRKLRQAEQTKGDAETGDGSAANHDGQTTEAQGDAGSLGDPQAPDGKDAPGWTGERGDAKEQAKTRALLQKALREGWPLTEEQSQQCIAILMGRLTAEGSTVDEICKIYKCFIDRGKLTVAANRQAAELHRQIIANDLLGRAGPPTEVEAAAETVEGEVVGVPQVLVYLPDNGRGNGPTTPDHPTAAGGSPD